MYKRQFHADVVTTNGAVAMIPDNYGQAQDRVEYAEAEEATIHCEFSDTGTVKVYGYADADATAELIATITDGTSVNITDSFQFLKFVTEDLSTDYEVRIVALVTYG